jgi:hypothetical protein
MDELKIVNRGDKFAVIFADPWGNTVYESEDFETYDEAEAFRDVQMMTAEIE